jgi:hypothetical protein
MYVDDSSNFHIAYHDATTDDLMYAVKVSGGGNCGLAGAQCDKIVDMPNDQYRPVGIDITEDRNGFPIIAYQSADGSLNVARPIAALGLPIEYGNCGPVRLLYPSWFCLTIDPHNPWVNYRNGDYVSIAVNSAGLGVIAYYEFIKDGSGNLGVSQQLLEIFMPYTVRSH